MVCPIKVIMKPMESSIKLITIPEVMSVATSLIVYIKASGIVYSVNIANYKRQIDHA